MVGKEEENGGDDSVGGFARLNVIFDALGQARFTVSNETVLTTYVTPTSTYLYIAGFVVVSAAFVASIIWLMVKLNDDDRIQKENSVRPVDTTTMMGGATPRGGLQDVESGAGGGGGKLTKGVADGKSILTSKQGSAGQPVKKLASASKSK